MQDRISLKSATNTEFCKSKGKYFSAFHMIDNRLFPNALKTRLSSTSLMPATTCTGEQMRVDMKDCSRSSIPSDVRDSGGVQTKSSFKSHDRVERVLGSDNVYRREITSEVHEDELRFRLSHPEEYKKLRMERIRVAENLLTVRREMVMALADKYRTDPNDFIATACTPSRVKFLSNRPDKEGGTLVQNGKSG